jgi:hypothetical protein
MYMIFVGDLKGGINVGRFRQRREPRAIRWVSGKQNPKVRTGFVFLTECDEYTSTQSLDNMCSNQANCCI